MKIGMEIVRRPTELDSDTTPITPEGLTDAVIKTADTGMAVKFVTSYDIFRLLHSKLSHTCKRRGLKLKYRQTQTRKRASTAPYEVIMWAERREDQR